MRALVVMILLVQACTPDARTWGDVAHELSAVYCETVSACYPDAELDVAQCAAHTEFHLCKLADTCSHRLSDEQGEAADQCLADVPEHNCLLLSWGGLPESCSF